MWKIGDILRANPGFEDEVGEGYTRFSLQRTPGGSFVTEIESSVLQDCLFKV